MHIITKVANVLHKPDIGLLLLRLSVGLVFIHAGWIKFGAIDAVVQGFAQIGFPAFLAYFVTYAELIGGVLVVLGLGAQYVGILFASIMVVAMFKVHWINGYGLQNGGFEYVFVLMLASLAITTLSAGSYSLDSVVRRIRQQAE